MILNRRMLLAAASGLAVWPAYAQEPPPALAAYERESGGRIGVYAENLATGAKIAWRAEERFVMCSTFKASLAAFVLARVDHGQEQLETMINYGSDDLLEYAPTARQNLAKGAMSVAEMCKAAVELSDNTCANLLLARVGGPAALDRVLALDWRCRLAPRSQRARAQSLAAGQSQRHHDADGHGGKPAAISARRNPVAGFARTPHRMDVELQDRKQSAARGFARGLADRRQDRQQRQGRIRRHRGGLAEIRRSGAGVCLHPGRFAKPSAARSGVCGNRTNGGPKPGLEVMALG